MCAGRSPFSNELQTDRLHIADPIELRLTTTALVLLGLESRSVGTRPAGSGRKRAISKSDFPGCRNERSRHSIWSSQPCLPISAACHPHGRPPWSDDLRPAPTRRCRSMRASRAARSGASSAKRGRARGSSRTGGARPNQGARSVFPRNRTRRAHLGHRRFARRSHTRRRTDRTAEERVPMSRRTYSRAS
jgi:hypothetical protein